MTTVSVLNPDQDLADADAEIVILPVSDERAENPQLLELALAVCALTGENRHPLHVWGALELLV